MAEEVHVGSGNRKSKLPRWQFVVTLIVVVVLAGGVGAWVRWYTANKEPQQSQVRERDLPAVVDDAQNLRAVGNLDEAKQKIDAGLNDPNTSNDIKYQLYIQQGSLALQAGSVTDAITSYEKAADLKMTYEIASVLGRAYTKAGDKATAISWYQKAIPLIPQEGNPLADADKEDMEEAIRSLGGQ
ncbi:MAG TPA: hypothetical protein VFB59_00695, partial [Candidatus Saccharimonadales bacterium]|nr:hypothetical protein [Candidatus Saccharimonadales bacterium]